MQGNNNPLDLDNNDGGDANAGGNADNPGVIRHVNLSDALKLIRRYNGRSSVAEWIRKFEADILAFGIPFKYVVNSLDRFFTDDAQNWWSSVCHNHESNDDDANEQDYQNIWLAIAVDMKEFFDSSALQSVNRKQNKALVFKCGDDPQQYVAQKLAFLKEIDRGMTDQKKVKNLIRGLPLELQLQFSSQEIATTGQFLKRLRQYSDILEENKAKQTSSSQLQTATLSKPSSSSHAATLQAAVKNNTKKPDNPKAETRTCFICRVAGHISRDCPQKGRLPVNQQAPRPTQNIPPLFPRPTFGRGGGRGGTPRQHQNFVGMPGMMNMYPPFMQYPMAPYVPPPQFLPPFNPYNPAIPLYPPRNNNMLRIQEMEQGQGAAPPEVTFPPPEN